MGADYGYDEINLNCGCPSDRVQNGAFGACLMREAGLVRDCVSAMNEAVDIPVTVKHRLGIDDDNSYDVVRDFVGTVAEGGSQVFIAHARNAWLKGLSPKENREVPPLKYEWVYQLKRDFPDLTIVINGGITSLGECQAHLAHVDGVMLGRSLIRTRGFSVRSTNYCLRSLVRPMNQILRYRAHHPHPGAQRRRH